MKKSLALILCLLMALCVLSACGGDPAVDPSADPGADPSVESSDAATGEEEKHIVVDSSGFEMEAEVASDGKVMVDGKVYIESNVTIPDYLGEISQMRTIESFVDLNETPTQDGQSNFEAIGAPYILYGEGLAVFLDDVWIYFMPAE